MSRTQVANNSLINISVGDPPMKHTDKAILEELEDANTH